MFLQTRAVKPITHLAASATAGQRGRLQRKCACGGTPGPSGECAACRRKRLRTPQSAAQPAPTIHAVGTADHRAEQEADQVAEQIMRMPASPRHYHTQDEAEQKAQRAFPQIRLQRQSVNEQDTPERPFCTGDPFLDLAAVREAIKQAWNATKSCASQQEQQFATGAENLRDVPAPPLEGSRNGTVPATDLLRETHFRVENNQPTAVQCSEFSEKVVFADSGINASTQAFFHTHPASRTVREAERRQDVLAAAENTIPLYIIAEAEVFVLNSPTRRVRWPRAKLERPCPQPAAPPPAATSEPLARKAIPAPRGEDAALLVAQQDRVSSGGQPLPTAARAFFEARFGHDFSRVRVHTDGRAAAAAHAVNALAYTIGHHITFGPGQYQPQSSNGRRLLAHELTHVVQQMGAPHQAPTLQRKVRIDEGAATGPSLRATVERLAGRSLTPADDGLQLADAVPTGGSPTVASFLQRAIAAQRTYRLRWGATRAGVAQAGRVTEEGGEIVITIDRAKVGEFTFTLDEVVAEQLVAAVTQFDRSAQPAPTATSQTTGQPLAPVTEDELVATPLTITAENQGEKQARIRAYVDQQLTPLTPAQRRLVYEAGWRAEGVPLTEIIRGVESNTPFRMKQRVEGGRVSATYVDPRNLPPTADRFDTAAFVKLLDDLSRVVTFVPGADEATAEAANLPKTGEACTPDEQQTAQNSCCSPAMLAEFRGHLSTAQAAVARTIQRLEGAQLIGCQVRKHLGDQSADADLQAVANRLRLAQSELALARHGWKCREKGSGVLGCDRRVVDGNEGFVGGSVRRGQTDILICVNNSAPFTTWATILHEVMHRVGVHGTETYQGDSGYPGNHPLENADSYAGLVATMGGSDWSPCRPWPFDVRGIVGSNLGPGFVLGARIEATPLGPGLRVVDWTLGVNFLWSPRFGVVPEAGDAPRNLVGRGYVGAETGVRLTLPRTHGALVFDAAAGLGALFPGGTDRPDLGLSARVGGRFRFGTGLSGPEVGLELSRLQSLAERGQGDWVVGVTAGFHFGRAGTRR
ncbi:MAG: DUF4157 domain-containing protein [Caldilineaceae bacterium]